MRTPSRACSHRDVLAQAQMAPTVDFGSFCAALLVAARSGRDDGGFHGAGSADTSATSTVLSEDDVYVHMRSSNLATLHWRANRGSPACGAY